MAQYPAQSGKYEGDWLADSRNGFGVWVEKNSQYYGEWRDDRPSGYGKASSLYSLGSLRVLFGVNFLSFVCILCFLGVMSTPAGEVQAGEWRKGIFQGGDFQLALQATERAKASAAAAAALAEEITVGLLGRPSTKTTDDLAGIIEKMNF